MASDHIVITSDAAFDADVINSDVPVLVDFWAVWCGPCKAIAPLLDRLADEKAGEVKIAKLDVDKNRATAMKYGVTSIPTLLVFKGGEVVNKKIGAGGGKAALEAWLTLSPRSWIAADLAWTSTDQSSQLGLRTGYTLFKRFDLGLSCR